MGESNQKSKHYLEMEDDVIQEPIFTRIQDKWPDDLSESEYVAKMNPGDRMIYLTFILEGQVMNTGFNGWFFSYKDEFRDEILAAYRLIKADRVLKIVEDAYSIFDRAKEVFWRAGGRYDASETFEEAWGAFTDTRKVIDYSALDEALVEAYDELCAARAAYIREHAEEFFIP